MLTTVALLLALTVPATVVSVYDGDTIRVEAAHWPGHTWTGSVRVLGIDTPEIRGKCPEEKAAAIAARDFVIGVVGDRVQLHNIKLGKFAGRVLAEVKIQDRTVTVDDGVVVKLFTQDLAQILIEQGHARPYYGGSRSGWCED